MSRPGPLGVVGVVLLAVLLVAVAGVGAVLYGSLPPRPDATAHGHAYEATVATDRPLTDVALRLPLPAGANESAVGRALARGDRAVVERSPAFDYRVVEGPALLLAADRLPAGRYRVAADLPAPGPVETREPTAPLLAPRTDPRPVDCRVTCARFDSRVGMRYGAPADARVRVRVTYERRNAWAAAEGWRGNRLRQTVRARARGPASGSVVANGTERAGAGTYPRGRLVPG